MKKVYDARVYVKLYGSDTYYDTSLFRNLVYREETEDIEQTFPTFESLYKYAATHFFRGIKVDQTLFGNDCVVLKGWQWWDTKKYTKRNYKPVTVKIAFEENHVSMAELMKELSHEKFCEYLKDKGLTFES